MSGQQTVADGGLRLLPQDLQLGGSLGCRGEACLRLSPVFQVPQDHQGESMVVWLKP